MHRTKTKRNFSKFEIRRNKGLKEALKEALKGRKGPEGGVPRDDVDGG